MYKFMSKAGIVAYTIDMTRLDAVAVVPPVHVRGEANKCNDGIAKAEPIKV